MITVLLVALILLAALTRCNIIIDPVYRSLRVDAYLCFEEAFPYRMAMQTAWEGIAPPQWFPGNVYSGYQLDPNQPVQIHRTRQKSACYSILQPSAFRWGIRTNANDPCTLHLGQLVEFPATQILSFVTTNPNHHPYRVSYVVPVRTQMSWKSSWHIGWPEQCSFEWYDTPSSGLVCNSRSQQSQQMLYTSLRPYALASYCAPLDGMGHATKPGRLGAYTIYYLSGPTFYPGGPPHDISVHGFGTYALDGLTIQDMQRANEYQWMTLTPVEPVEAYPYLPDPPPYPPGSENNFLFDGLGTYEIPCIFRNTVNPQPNPLPGAFANRIFKWQADEIVSEETPSLFSESFIFGNRIIQPHVARGMRAIVAYSSRDPRPGYLPWYCQQNTYDDYWLGQTSLGSIIENLWRVYHGVTETKRHIWKDDPQNRGWGFAEFAFVHGWFTQECEWHYYGDDPAPPRWSAWYVGGVQIRITGGGDVNDPAFRQWILSHDAGFGVLFEPRYAVCNDVLSGCVGQPNAMGEHVFPDHPTQVSSAWTPQDGQPVPTPCQQRGLDSKSFRWFDTVGCALWNKGPHCGLYHEIKRRRFTTPDYQTYEEQYGWAKLAFTTTPPVLVEVQK